MKETTIKIEHKLGDWAHKVEDRIEKTFEKPISAFEKFKSKIKGTY